jgi:ATP-dependent helicase/nuclease subunit B
MGTQSGAGIDAWLREGGVVVASSDRAARAIQSDFHRRRRDEGLTAWPAPNVVSSDTFVREAWEERNLDGRLLLNAAQEQAVWSEIIHSEQHLPTALRASVRRLAGMAMEAHDLLCSYAPEFLRDSARAGWDQDAGQFSDWLKEFNEYCSRNKLISLSRVPLELIPLLGAESAARSPLRLAGFDRILPIQQRVFDAWGEWLQFQPEGRAQHIRFHTTPDIQSELETCAFWCHKQIEENPDTRLLVICQNLSQLRGEIERAFLRFNPPGAMPKFEFSLGVPLAQIPLVRSALLLLRWLDGALAENELDWLFSSGLAATPDESAALQSSMRTLRRYDLQRVEWTLEAFLNEHAIRAVLPSQWKQRAIPARRGMKESGRTVTPGDWADKIPQLLEVLGWPGPQAQSSVDFQARRRWQQALDTAGSLGFDGRRISWHGFLIELENATSDILFAPQSMDAPVQIAGPAESAGLTADAIWFLGADEDSWPAVASMHPFLPSQVQRGAAMPHTSHLQDWEFSAGITHRLLASAPVVHFSYARQKAEIELRPSRLLLQVAGAPQSSSDLQPPPHELPLAESFIDSSRIPFSLPELRGGSSVLSSQSQCAFKAFASVRLGAKTWDAAEAGLTAKQRGQILHAVLHSVWSGKKPGIGSHDELRAIGDLPAFVRTHVKSALSSGISAAVKEQMPAMYLELEETRLIRLITEWLKFEKARVPFSVEETEAERSVTIAGLMMRLRLDRVDRLIDDSHLVIDYKTGSVDPKSWDLPRPDDVQLPLYKLFGLEPVQPSLFESYSGRARGGLVFARVRTGDSCFAGRVADARATINPELNGNSSLVKRKLSASDEAEWKQAIEQLAEDFIHGRADVDPRDYPTTCEYCGLQSICRIQEPENREPYEEAEEAEADNDAEE